MAERKYRQIDSPWIDMSHLDWGPLTDERYARHFFRGHIFYGQQEYSENVFIIKRGRVAMCLCTPEGDMRNTMVLDAGCMFGNQTLFDGSPNSCQAEVVSDEYDINGIALSKTMANELRKIRVPSTGQRFYPEIPINLQVGSLDGIPAATSGTVNGRLITPATGILAFLGDFRLIKWGMVRDIWSEIIEYGDPDNTGKDLKGVNQIAYRTEAMYSYAILDPKGIAVLKKPTSTGRTAK